MKKVLFAAVIILLIGGLVYGYNYYTVNRPVQQELNSDERDSGIAFDAHYQNYVQLDVLVLNLKEISGEKTKVDVFRALWQSAFALKNREFKEVRLDYQGDARFILPGDYFNKLGNEYDNENPIYVIRTFPENVLNLDGQHAYQETTGGILGVMATEMDYFSDFSEKWYLKSFEAK